MHFIFRILAHKRTASHSWKGVPTNKTKYKIKLKDFSNGSAWTMGNRVPNLTLLASKVYIRDSGLRDQKYRRMNKLQHLLTELTVTQTECSQPHASDRYGIFSRVVCHSHDFAYCVISQSHVKITKTCNQERNYPNWIF